MDWELRAEELAAELYRLQGLLLPIDPSSPMRVDEQAQLDLWLGPRLRLLHEQLLIALNFRLNWPKED